MELFSSNIKKNFLHFLIFWKIELSIPRSKTKKKKEKQKRKKKIHPGKNVLCFKKELSSPRSNSGTNPP